MTGLDTGGLRSVQDIWRHFRGKQDRERELATAAAVQHAPDVYAEADGIARGLGIETSAVLEDVNKARGQLLLQDAAKRAVDGYGRKSVLDDRLKDVRFLSMARDDLGNLQTTEDSWAWIGRSWQTARDMSRRGTIGAAALLGGRDLTLSERRELEQMDERARVRQEREPGFLDAAINLVGSSLDSLATGAAAGGVTGLAFPPAAPFVAGAGAFSQSWRIEAGNLYADLIQNGSTPSEAAGIASTYGTAIAAVDLVGLKAGTAPFRETLKNVAPQVFARGLTQQTRANAFRGALQSYGTAVLGESGTEALQEAIGILAEQRAAGADARDFDWSRVGAAFTETAKGMVVLGAFGSGGQFLSDVRRAGNAEHNARVFRELNKVGAESKLGARSPNDRAEYVNDQAEGTGSETVYVRGDQFAGALNQLETESARDTGVATTLDDLRKLLPGVAEQVQEAAETGGDVAIPVGDWEAHLARTELGQRLINHATFDPDDMTASEAAEFAAVREQEADKARDAVAQDEDDAKLWRKSRRRVEARLYDQLRATDRMPARDARASAQFYGAFVATQAERLGMTPAEFDARYQLTVAAGDASGGALRQTAIDTPEFRAWFGESKVVNGRGQPMAVYHGTYTHFAEFRGDGPFYFADREVATEYANATSSPHLMEVWLSIRNPKAIDDLADLEPYLPDGANYEYVYEALEDVDVVNAVKAAGYDGARLTADVLPGNVGEHESWVAFDPTQIKSVDNRGTFAPEDANILNARDRRGAFSPERLAVLLTEKADASTFLHEAAHYFLTVYADLAAREDAPQTVVDDMGKLLSWLGVDGLEEWNGRSIEEQRAAHEAFAVSFEQYLHEGQAPSAELAGLSQRFAAWLRRIYRNIRDQLNQAHREEFGEDLPILTGEVRQVMDRMLASEEEVSRAEAARGMMATFRSFEASGMSSDEWEAYRSEEKAAHDDSVEELTRASLRNMRWLSGARGRLLKELQAKADAQREEVRSEVELELLDRPEFAVPRFIRTGEMLRDGQLVRVVTENETRMDRDEVLRILGLRTETAPKLRRLRRSRRGRSLAQFIRDSGGISWQSWQTFPGEKGTEFRPRGIVRSKRSGEGIAWYYMANEARAEGYGPQGLEYGEDDYAWFTEAIAGAAGGAHVYTAQDMAAYVEAEPDGRALPSEAEMKRALREQIREEDAARAEEREALRPFSKLLIRGGVATDQMAEAFGVETGAELVRLINEAPSFEAAVAQRTDQRMLEEYGELVDAEAVEIAIESALHNEARARMVATELRAAAKATAPTRVLVQAAKDAAAAILATKKVGELRPYDYSVAEARATRQARRAVASGELEVAREAMRRQLLNHQLAKQAADARAQVQKQTRELRRFLESDKKLAKTRDTNVIQVARSILALYGLGQAPDGKGPLDWLQVVQQHEPDTVAKFSAQVLRAVIRSQESGLESAQWRDLTLSEWTELMDLAESLWFESGRVRRVTLNDRRMSAAEAGARVVEQLEKGLPDAPEITEAPGAAQTAKNWLKGFLANATRIEHLFLRLDGGKPGVMTSLFRRVKEGGDDYRSVVREKLEAYEELLRRHDFGPGGKIDARKELRHVFRGGKAELIGYLRHAGNDSNRSKLLVGRKWGALNEDGTLDSAAWDAFIKRMVREGVLTRADFELVQAIWDLNETMKADAQRAHYRNFGFYFKEVAAKPFTVQFPDGSSASFRGGYVPAKVDSNEDANAARHEIDSLAEFHKSLPTVPRGFTMSRKEQYARPLSFDLAEGANHIAQVLRFVYLQEPVEEVRRVLHRREVQDTLRRVSPAIYTQILDPWLKRAAMQSSTKPQDAENAGERIIGALSRNANMGIMFANVSNSVQNFTGLLNALTKVSGRELMAALLSPRGGRQYVEQRSKFMAEHLGRQVFDVQNQIRRISAQDGAVRKGLTWIQRNAYFLQQITQNVVDVAVWRAAYNDSLIAAPGNEAEAVRRADSAVRTTQMATDPDDISSWEHAGALQKALFPFQSWFINWANNAGFSAAAAQTLGERVGVYLYGVMFPIVLAQIVSDGLSGRLEDDEGDGWGDEAWSLWWRSQIGAVTASTPFFGRAGQQIVNVFLDDKVWNDRMPAPPFVEAFSRGLQALRDLRDGKATSRDAQDIVTMFANLSGVPVGALTNRLAYAYRVSSGEIEPSGAVDYGRGLLTGR